MSAAITGTASSPGSREVELSIRGMTCAACAGAMTVTGVQPAPGTGYNIAAIPLAAAGFLNPLTAGAAMAASSAFVVASSIRLRRFGTTDPPGRSRRPAGSARGSGAGSSELREEGLPCRG